MRKIKLFFVVLTIAVVVMTEAFIPERSNPACDPHLTRCGASAEGRSKAERMDFSPNSILRYSSMDAAGKSTWYSNVAKTYQEYRPTYSEAIVTYMIQRCPNLKPTDMLLEIGSGPGTATSSFAGLVKNITCVEPNVDFCEIAAKTVGQKFPNVEILHTSLENYTTDVKFDAILAASSIHWLDPDIAREKCASLLKDGGSLLLLWNNMVQPTESVIDGLKDIYIKYAPHLFEPYVTPGVTRLELLREVGNRVAFGAFENLQFGYTIENLELSAFEYCQTLLTYSPYFVLETRDELFRQITHYIDTQLGGTISLTYEAAFHTATKVRISSSPDEL